MHGEVEQSGWPCLTYTGWTGREGGPGRLAEPPGEPHNGPGEKQDGSDPDQPSVRLFCLIHMQTRAQVALCKVRRSLDFSCSWFSSFSLATVMGEMPHNAFHFK